MTPAENTWCAAIGAGSSWRTRMTTPRWSQAQHSALFSLLTGRQCGIHFLVSKGDLARGQVSRVHRIGNSISIAELFSSHRQRARSVPNLMLIGALGIYSVGASHIAAC